MTRTSPPASRGLGHWPREGQEPLKGVHVFCRRDVLVLPPAAELYFSPRANENVPRRGRCRFSGRSRVIWRTFVLTWDRLPDHLTQFITDYLNHPRRDVALLHPYAADLNRVE